ncbi:MAG: hypothetical protein AAF206_28460, partial [Bacteroidota bacterium]
LKKNLAQKGADTSALKPSTAINPFFLKHAWVLMWEVNKIAPGTMSDFDHQPHKLTRIGGLVVLVGLLSLIGCWLLGELTWWLILPILIGMALSHIGAKMPAERLDVSGFQTFRELIDEMDANLR